MEQIEKMTPEQFRNLSSEEKKEFVRKLIHSEAAEVHAAFFNPQTKEAVDMRGLVEQFGEEKALDIIIEAFEKGNTEAKTLTGDDIKALILKAQRGECTEDELNLLEFIQSQIMDKEDCIHFQRSWLSSSIDLINFAQTEVEYSPQVVDLLSAMIILFTVSGTLSENGALSKYTINDGPMLTEMCGEIADDIYNTWAASCTSLPDPELIMLSLIQLACKIAHENCFTFSNGMALADALNIDLCSCEDCNEDAEESNGSNEQSKVCKPIVHPAKDADMRDLLKE